MQHEEDKIQMMLVAWFRLQYPKILMTISPGGLITNAKSGNKANKMGYSKGTPDLLILQPSGKYHGLLIELKSSKGKASPEQIVWLGKLLEKGYYAHICIGFEEAKSVIDGYLQ